MEIRLVDKTSSVLDTPRIAADRFGRPHIVYGYLIDDWSADYALKYAYRDRFGWHIENISDLGQTGPHSSIAVDILGRPRIAYLSYPEGSLMYAVRDGAGWHAEEIDPDPSAWPVLCLDRNGEPRGVYSYLPSWFTREKRYASRGSDGWSIETLDQEFSGEFTGFDIDLLGTDHIAFVQFNPGIPGNEVVYLSRDAAGWHEEVVVQGRLISDYAELAVNENGLVGIKLRHPKIVRI